MEFMAKWNRWYYPYSDCETDIDDVHQLKYLVPESSRNGILSLIIAIMGILCVSTSIAISCINYNKFRIYNIILLSIAGSMCITIPLVWLFGDYFKILNEYNVHNIWLTKSFGDEYKWWKQIGSEINEFWGILSNIHISWAGWCGE